MEITTKNYFTLKSKGLKRADIAKHLNLSESQLKKLITKNGWAGKKPEVKNSYIFKEFSKSSCYWAGFIAADGCVMDNGALKIMLHYDDTAHLEKFKSFIGSSHKISSNTDKYYRSELGFRNPSIIEGLRDNFNVVPRKSLIYKFPDSVPQAYLKDFLRGYFDGDGCICESFSNVNSKTATVYTTIIGSDIFIDKVVALLTDMLGITGCVQQKQNVRVVKYNTNNSLSLLKFLYEDAEDFLDRKHALYTKIVINNDRLHR